MLSVFVMASRPWGCSVSSEAPTVSCDWVTSRWVAAGWLVAALGMGFISWKRWRLALAANSLLLIAFSLVSTVGVFTLAPAAFWFGCALWLSTRDSRPWFVVSSLATVAILSLAIFGVQALFYLATVPI
jgi:hypothetical protein